MVLNTLGETIDIHGGGKDLIFPHHENEIAQSEALTGKPLANYWIHNGLVKIDGQKMSKSLGNSLTIKDALAKYNPEVIKYAIVSKSYATEIDLKDSEFALAEQHMYYFYNTLKAIENFLAANTEMKEVANEVADNIETKFREAMDDDFNTPVAIANLFSDFKYVNNLLKDNKVPADEKAYILNKIKTQIIKLYNILGIFYADADELIQDLQNKYITKLGLKVEEIEQKISDRATAKAEKNYEVADQIRNDLDRQGIILNDSKEGTTWDIKELYNL